MTSSRICAQESQARVAPPDMKAEAAQVSEARALAAAAEAARLGSARPPRERRCRRRNRAASPPHSRGSANTATGSSGVVGRGGVAAESGGEGATVAGGDIREERAAAKSRGAAERTIERRRDREPGREGVDGGDGRRDQDGGGWIGNLG
jgi:hypothetical protein